MVRYNSESQLPKAILVFNGDYNARNKKGETAWDIILTNFQSKMLSNMDKSIERYTVMF